MDGRFRSFHCPLTPYDVGLALFFLDVRLCMKPVPPRIQAFVSPVIGGDVRLPASSLCERRFLHNHACFTSTRGWDRFLPLTSAILSSFFDLSIALSEAFSSTEGIDRNFRNTVRDSVFPLSRRRHCRSVSTCAEQIETFFFFLVDTMKDQETPSKAPEIIFPPFFFSFLFLLCTLFPQ